MLVVRRRRRYFAGSARTAVASSKPASSTSRAAQKGRIHASLVQVCLVGKGEVRHAREVTPSVCLRLSPSIHVQGRILQNSREPP